jgi:hypothetical protein
MDDTFHLERISAVVRAWPEWCVAGLRGTVVLFGAWVVGAIVAHMTATWLAAQGFDNLWTPPWTTRDADTKRSRRTGVSLSKIAGRLVTISFLAVGLFLIARWERWMALKDFLHEVTVLVWKLALLFTACLYVSRQLATTALDVLGADPIRKAMDGLFPEDDRNESSFSDSVLKACGIFIYVMVFTLLSLTATDLLHWASLRSGLLAVWTLGLHIGTAVAILAIGALGVRWLFGEKMPAEPSPADKAMPPAFPVSSGFGVEAPVPPEPNADRESGKAARASVGRSLAITAVLLVALATLASQVFNALFLLAILVLVLIGAFTFRDYLPDIVAGIVLRQKDITRVMLEGKMVTLLRRGLLSSQVEKDGTVFHKPNKSILDALLRPDAHKEDVE